MNADAVAALLHDVLGAECSGTHSLGYATCQRQAAALAAIPLPSEPESLDHAPGCDVFRIAESWEPYGEPRHCDCGFALWDAKRRGVYNWTPPEGAGKHQWTDAPDDEEAWFCTACHIVECGRCPHPSSCPAPLPSDTPAVPLRPSNTPARPPGLYAEYVTPGGIRWESESGKASDTPADGLDVERLIYAVHQAINGVPAMVVTNTEYVPQAKRRADAVVDRHRVIVAVRDAIREYAALALTQEPRSGDDR